jgi:hypothetical protein
MVKEDAMPSHRQQARSDKRRCTATAADRRHLVPFDSWAAMAALGFLAVVTGVAFIFLRPNFILLPEDQSFTGLSPEELRRINPALFAWIGMVFRSWGGFATGLGVIIVGVACTGYRTGLRWAWWVLGLATLTTLSVFAWVNFALKSEFLPLIALAMLLVLVSLWRSRKAGRAVPAGHTTITTSRARNGS